MSMELSMSRSQKLLKIPWTRKVRRCRLFDMSVTILRHFLVRILSELVAQVKDEQSYIVVRERVHRNTAESTNARVKWWSLIQLLILIGEGIFQVWWIKRFFEVSSPFLALNPS